MQFNGSVVDFKSTKNGISAKKFDGKASFEFEVVNGKPSAVKIESACAKGDIRISIQFGERSESVSTGSCRIDFSDCDDGKYVITATAKNAENVAVNYEFV